MKSFLLILTFSSLAAKALPPIEGGKSAMMTSLEYMDIIKLGSQGSSDCTGTKVSPTLILTAAHCVTLFQDQQVTETLKPGSFLLGAGKIVKATIHPQYASAKIAARSKPGDAKLAARATLYDVAFIEIVPRASTNPNKAYPKIISAQTKMGQRNKMEMAGYGANEAFWNGEKFDYRTTKADLQLANNTWKECPLDYFGDKLKAITDFEKSLKTYMSVKASRVHTISSGTEVITNDGNGMILPGDSGSPSMERDESRALVITGVASAIIPYGDDSGAASFEIEVDGKLITKKDIGKLPEDWGRKNKSENDFVEITSVLKEKDLLTESGEPKPGVVIKRKYKRVTEGKYSDLSHPDNQKFIQAIMK